MNSETLQEFIRQAESSLPAIRGSILICQQNGDSPRGEMNAALRQATVIKDMASEHGLREIERAAGELEKELESALAAQTGLSSEMSRRLLDKVAVLEAHLTKITLKVDFFPSSVEDFIEDSFENLQIKPREPARAEREEEDLSETSEETEEEEEFEIDEEMLEVFAEEAEELLQNINAHLKILENNPNDREALLEVRRSAHTLKGSAGIIGLKKLSDLAHRVEDLLDYLAENEIEAGEKIFVLLLASTDCFSALAGGENSTQLNNKISRLYRDFDEVLASLKKGAEEPETPNTEFQILNSEITYPDLNASTSEDQRPKTEDRPANPQSEISNPKAVVRVSLERLDELIKMVGDLAVSRSVFERYLLEFEQQNEELRNNTNRLQRSTGKLESEFEVDAMQFSNAGFQIPNSRFQMPDSRFSRVDSAVETNITAHSSTDFDALEFDRYTEFHQTTRDLVETATDTYAINTELDTLKNKLEILFDSQRRLIEEMQEKLLRLRLVKFGMLSPRFHRTVRVTCEEEEKLADLFIEGENQEFDTQILDSLVEPLLHLLRNAVAHGIETPETRRLLGKDERGTIRLRVQSEGTHVNLTISDDGRGVSAASLIEKAVQNNFIAPDEAEKMREEEAFSLMFLPGLTTADKLSMTAGRGVGMNVVKTSIQRQQGTISVNSEIQKGSTFAIRLPLALALTRALIVKAGGLIFAFPSKSVKQVSEISLTNTDRNARPKFTTIDTKNYSILYLNEVLNLPTAVKSGSSAHAPVLKIDFLKTPSVLAVDEIVGIEEIVIKPLGAPLQNSPEFLGATILGDGRVVPVLDLIYLLAQKVQSRESKAKSSSSKAQSPAKPQNSISEGKSEIQNPKSEIINVMVVDDSPTVRRLTSNLIKNAGWQVIVAKDGLEALEILQAFQELPAAILTDVEMPRMDGYELLSALKREEKLRQIPVVMITSRSSEKHRQKAFELGVSEYLTKPFEDAKLIETVKKLSNQGT